MHYCYKSIKLLENKTKFNVEPSAVLYSLEIFSGQAPDIYDYSTKLILESTPNLIFTFLCRRQIETSEQKDQFDKRGIRLWSHIPASHRDESLEKIELIKRSRRRGDVKNNAGGCYQTIPPYPLKCLSAFWSVSNTNEILSALGLNDVQCGADQARTDCQWQRSNEQLYAYQISGEGCSTLSSNEDLVMRSVMTFPKQNVTFRFTCKESCV